ncbi:MAG: SUMF1/EgtB/PvdO family nonheme iron enzyme [Vicinamibacterales bacterium]
MTVSTLASTSRTHLVDWYRRNRERSRGLFDLLDPDVYYSRPIALRNPIVFYEGHLPAFSVISLLKRGLGRPGVDERLETLFARGIDPDSEQSAAPRSGADTRWPARQQVLAFGRDVDAAIVEALEGATFDVSGRDHPAMTNGEAVFTALEHEAMHQETLLYMWRRLPYEQKRKPSGVRYETAGMPPRHAAIEIPRGRATLGARRGAIPFGWDNEFEGLVVDVPAFDIDLYSVTNVDWLAFMADGGYDRRELWPEVGWEWRVREGVRHPAFWQPTAARPGAGHRDRPSHGEGEWAWRGMFEDIPLPHAWPVYVSQAEAVAYARWKGRRLPTEAEYHRAAFGTPGGVERELPWGDRGSPLDASRGACDFDYWEPVPAGSRPAGASAWGVHDLMSNGWEWTSTMFAPFPRFTPMASYPEYSAEFFDGQHVVLKGASPATAKELIRRSFRNWFRPNYPYVYAKFRTVSAER